MAESFEVRVGDKVLPPVLKPTTILQSEALHQYVLETSVHPREPEALKELRQLTATHPWTGLAAGADEMQFLRMLLKLMNAKKTLEIGVFTGYSLLSTALSLPHDGEIIAIDTNRKNFELGLPVFKKAGVAHKIEFREGLALPILDEMMEEEKYKGWFDFVFVDADKSNYHERVIDGEGGGHGRSRDAIVEFNAYLAADPRVEICHLTISDGFTLCPGDDALFVLLFTTLHSPRQPTCLFLLCRAFLCFALPHTGVRGQPRTAFSWAAPILYCEFYRSLVSSLDHCAQLQLLHLQVGVLLEIVGAAVSNAAYTAASALLKRFWSLKSTTKTAVSGHRPLMKFESGCTVETVFDGSKLGIEPYSVEVTQSGELLLLDSVNSNLYRIPLPLSRYSRPKLIAGSPEGYVGHIDGRPREARMNHPKGFTVDERGNIYVADTMNMAVRKISDAGVTTIAGGKWSRGGHSDGPSEDAKFSNDFEVIFIASSCSLLVVDRGNQAIREIQLNFDDCAHQYETGFPLGIAVLLAAGFFGYMLALLQRWLGTMVSTQIEPTKASMSPYQKPIKPSIRPPLIPTGDEAVHVDEEGLFSLTGKLLLAIAEIFGAMFPIFKKRSKTKYHHHHHHQQQQQQQRANTWSVPESLAIPDDEIPPPLETRARTPRKTYAFMSKEPEKIHHIRHAPPYLMPQQQMQTQQVHQQQHLQQHRQFSPGTETYYGQSCKTTTNEIVFGAVQESDSKRRAVEMKAVNHGDHMYEQYRVHY
ncbi:NHL repeat-containing protein [Musa troglodytarum]|uniref:NHL repeat-containing protein n=1 Tax=Musa troglodytarum TaxID=320322 RepID=A0A9E7LBY4_9LILI|nr:NHL repeat-containing protein [Musa troglodytarum]